MAGVRAPPGAIIFLFFNAKEKSFSYLMSMVLLFDEKQVTFNGYDAKLQVKLWCLSVTVENCVIGHHGIWAIIAFSTNLLSVRITFWRIFNLILIQFSKYGGLLFSETVIAVALVRQEMILAKRRVA